MSEGDLHRALTVVDEVGNRSTRLIDDAQRLWERLGRFLGMGLAPGEVDRPALQLACFALQLPLKRAAAGRASAGPRGGLNLRERCAQSAEMLLDGFADSYPADLLERTVALLREMPSAAPATVEARLLADAVNLDDFGLVGMVSLALQLGRAGGTPVQLVEAFAKRQAYGYWEVRLKSGFHFPAVRELARQRLERAERVVAELERELKEDEP
jgi:hypothetical protein